MPCEHSVWVKFFFCKIFCGNLNETILLVEIDSTFKLTLILVHKIVSFRFPREIFLTRELCFRVIQKVHESAYKFGYFFQRTVFHH